MEGTAGELGAQGGMEGEGDKVAEEVAERILSHLKGQVRRERGVPGAPFALYLELDSMWLLL